MNSEIYNHVKINEGIDKKYHIQSHSDSVVIAYMYQQMKEGETYEDLARKMDGKFAFILYDESKNFLFVGRDHVGLCPMYWG